MYEFHYNYIKQKNSDKAKLLYSNDSLTYDIKTEEVYDDFWIDKVKFDKSDYPRLVSSTIKQIRRALNVKSDI